MSRLQDKIIGNDELISSLMTMIGENRLPHAVILTGRAGSGRRSLARELARAVACTGSQRPCGVCPACRGTENPDITVVTPEKNEITVGQVREVRAAAYIAPNQSAARVFIIPDAQLMNETAQNALLKVLEEPPAQVYFFLTCEYPHQLIDTVLSRAVSLRVSLPDRDDACDHICNNYPDHDRAEVESAFDSAGTVGGALTLLGGGNKLREQAAEVLRFIDAANELELLRALLPFANDRRRAQSVIEQMLELLHDVLAVKSGAVRRPDSTVSLMCQRLGAGRIMRLIDACERAHEQCESNIGEGLLATHFCACLRRAVDL